MLTNPGDQRRGGPDVPPATCLALWLNFGLKRKPGYNPWKFTLNFAEVQNLRLLDPQLPKDGGAN